MRIELVGTDGDKHASGIERPRLVQLNFQPSTAPRPQPIRIRLPPALFRHGRLALGNRKAGTHLKMFYPAWKYGRPARVLALLGQGRAEEMIAAPAFWCPNPVQTNCLRVKGTSMSPLINDGDIVAVDGSQTNPEELNRKIVVAWHRQSGLSLARFIAADGVHLLESENRDYSPVTVEKDRKWQIVGKVLWWIRKGP